ncbi:hypothetical protein Tco_1165715 [Tanacetum coccineum]
MMMAVCYDDGEDGVIVMVGVVVAGCGGSGAWGEWGSGSGRSGGGEYFWCSPDMSAGKVFRRWWGSPEKMGGSGREFV